MSSKNDSNPRVAVREIHLEKLFHGIVDLQGYARAWVVFRFQGQVVGQAWMPVYEGQISIADLRSSARSSAWPVWQRLVTRPHDVSQPLLSASVVVCTRNRTSDLTNCLRSLQPLRKQGRELIVVDSCPDSDSTARLVAGYPEIRYICEPRPGAGIARNRGLLAATGDIIAFTDDDAEVDPGWLQALLGNFADPMVAIVTGITLPLELETGAQIWFERTNGFARGFERKSFDVNTRDPLGAGVVGASVNVAIRRSALNEIGLFVECLGPGTPAYCGEDHEFFYRALARGYRIVYDPMAIVRHRHRREWHDLRKTIYGYGAGVFAWWTHALLAEKEFSLFRTAPRWFLQHHCRNLARAIFLRPDSMPLDLAWAEFRGALAGPICYLRSRRNMRAPRQDRQAHMKDVCIFKAHKDRAAEKVAQLPLARVSARPGNISLETE